jgi:hypothetical protein
MGFLPLTYGRPGYVDKEQFVQAQAATYDADLDKRRDVSLSSERSGASAGIPDALTFDKVINEGTCPVSLCVNCVLFICLGC